MKKIDTEIEKGEIMIENQIEIKIKIEIDIEKGEVAEVVIETDTEIETEIEIMKEKVIEMKEKDQDPLIKALEGGQDLDQLKKEVQEGIE